MLLLCYVHYGQIMDIWVFVYNDYELFIMNDVDT